MRTTFTGLISLLSLMVIAKITMPLWSHHAPSALPITPPIIASSAIPIADAVLAPSIKTVTISALMSIAEISIAEAAEALPTGKDADILASLRSFQLRLEEREKKLDIRAQKLAEIETKALIHIDDMKKMESALREMLKQEDSIKTKKIKRLTAVYAGMKPERSAPVIARMDLETVVKIFLRMKEKKVGKILSFLPTDKAVIISEALTQRIITLKR
ncbi:MAG: hypothetical protein R8J85_02045 [Mariprofundales bacterium]